MENGEKENEREEVESKEKKPVGLEHLYASQLLKDISLMGQLANLYFDF